MRTAALLLLLASFGADAIVVRDDVPDLRYRMAVSEFPALADLPGEGHGVLIAPQWVVTAAHAVAWQQAVDAVVVGGTPRAVRRIVVHPGYKQPPQAMIDAALKSGDWEAFFAFAATSDDIALIELAEPVRDVAPARIYHGSALGKVVRIVGRGATGTGSKGHSLHGPNRTALRQGYNRIGIEETRWIGYTFDAPPKALPLEASTGSGDSGGPILVAVDKQWQVAGVTAWKRGLVEGTELRPGRYGETSYGVRLGNYADWIEETTASGGDSGKSAGR
ncbi:S1 family peptidase [Lysobacter sp. Hz 25]|uniref:S1 family peptidase n=1 Tax=Lysobacter sp. Hz 25 TaxID=3383698 RepID=UPI0038D50DD6